VHTLFIVTVLGVAALSGCKRDSGAPQPEQRHDPVVDDVVARIGGHSIGVLEVEDRMAAAEVGAEAALDRIIDEVLLVQEAERLGLSEDREDERSVERLMVRTMLHDLEKESTPESVSGEELQKAYDLHTSSFRVPERRRSWHILVEEQSEAAEALAESILRELQQASDPRNVYERYEDGGLKGLTLEVTAEDLPAMSKTANLKKSYKDALFAAESEGPLKKAVKTSYGWHAIVLAEILPEEVRTIDEVEGEIRKQVSQTKRLAKIVTIVQSLEGQGLVHYDERGVDLLLSMSGLPERAE
jgi:parvulin-like peptidyl-prolyl isomerase